MPKSKNRRKNAGKKKPANAQVVAEASAASSETDASAPSVGPVKYVGQVRQEMRKVVWPGWPEVYKTTILVMIMVVIMGIFFFAVDTVVANVTQFILGFGER